MTNVVPLPARQPLFVEPAGRPGDWWEPLQGAGAQLLQELRPEARQRRLPIDLLAALLVERALIEDDIAACGISAIEARSALERAATLSATLGPGHLNTSYVQMLRAGDQMYEPESEAQLAHRDLSLPLRLHASAPLVLEQVETNPAAVAESLRFEVAAAAAGQFMREWALRVLLGAAAA